MLGPMEATKAVDNFEDQARLRGALPFITEAEYFAVPPPMMGVPGPGSSEPCTAPVDGSSSSSAPVESEPTSNDFAREGELPRVGRHRGAPQLLAGGQLDRADAVARLLGDEGLPLGDEQARGVRRARAGCGAPKDRSA